MLLEISPIALGVGTLGSVSVLNEETTKRKDQVMGLQELRQQFIVDENVLARQLEDLVGALKIHTVVSQSGDVHLLKAGSIPVKVRVQLALSARLVASKLDDRIPAAVSLDQLQKYVGVSREQLRARVSDLVRERFVEATGDGLYEAAPHRVDAFVRGLSSTDRSGDAEIRVRKRATRPASPRRSSAALRRPRTQLVDLVHGLIDAGFFRQPKDLRAIQNSLAESGHHYPVTTLSGAMLTEVRRRNLRRMKQGKLWVYVNA